MKARLGIFLLGGVLASAQQPLHQEKALPPLEKHLAPEAKEGPYIELSGQGSHVCVTTNQKTFWPSVARAETADEARRISKELCRMRAEYAIECGDTQCEKSVSRSPEVGIERFVRNLPDEKPNIPRFTYRLGVLASPHMVTLESTFRKFSYMTFAETKLEAEAYAWQLCLSDAGREKGESCRGVASPGSRSNSPQSPRTRLIRSLPTRVDFDVKIERKK